MRAINPHGPQVPNISQAMLVQNSGLLFLSGHVPMGPRGTVGTAIES
jgi:enamine deaminase RidA (YjgF/YER057c/UK114 family)